MNLTIDLPGKPRPKARPRMVRGKIWTPSTPHEDEVATQMLVHQGKFAGQKGLSISTWFYGAHPRSDGDNLLKLVVDAAVKAGVIDDDKVSVVVQGSYECRGVNDEGNPFPGQPSTRVRIGLWK